MMIDYTYFDNILTRIPGINTCGRDGEPTEQARQLRADLDTLILTHAPRFLSALLGMQWGALIERDDVWNLIVDPEAHTSPLAKYIWCRWAQLQATRTTAAGEKVKQGEFSNTANASYRIAEVWNIMVDECIDIVAALSRLDGVATEPNLSAEIFEKQNVFGV